MVWQLSSRMRPHRLHVWATLVYWMSKVAGVLVLSETAVGRHKFTAAVASAGLWWWARARAWNVICLAAVVHRIAVETWPVTVKAITHLPQASCYDTVCGGVWCVYACVYYAVAWLDRVSEICALAAAITWRQLSTVECLNSALGGCLDDDDDGGGRDRAGRPSASDIPWHAYLILVFPVAQFAMAANVISLSHNGVWRSAMAVVAAAASCAPVAAHGTASAMLVMANNSMQSINRQITHLLPVRRLRRVRSSGDNLDANDTGDIDENCRQQDVIAQLARRHWRITGLVTGGVCGAFGVDLMTAVLLAAVRVTYVAISVFHRLTDDSDARTNMSLAVVVQLIAWFGQFAYLAYTCDDLAAQVFETLIL